VLRAMLIDDEPIALEGLKLLIDWQAEGFEICCECASAVEALKKLPKARPDLIVTDIRMPGMSGLDLLGAARQTGFSGQFVVVSGYGDFNYAKRALQLGVAGYLLKPVDPVEAAGVLAHVRRKLIDREALINQRNIAAHHAITQLLAGGDVTAEDIPEAKRWVVATWGAPLPGSAAQTLLSLLAPAEATAHIVEDKEYLVLRLQTDSGAPDFREAEALLATHNRPLDIGEPVSDSKSLPMLRKQLSDQLDSQCGGKLTERVEALVRAISLRQTDECITSCAALDTLCLSCGVNAVTRARRQLLSACSGLLSNRPDALQSFVTAQDADFLTMCLLAVKLLAPEQERVSDRIERFVNEHAAERITLAGIAEALGYNATYIGRKFYEERGSGFREWLIRQRMEQGAALLRSTQQSVNTIARAVGFEHYKRFLRHFKRRFGMAPEQYRRQKP